MDVSIIFVNYRTKELTINAVKSVIEQTDGIEYEIFVVDNNSGDCSIEAVEKEFNGIELPLTPAPSPSRGEGNSVYIIKNPINAGFGAANNLAIKQAKGKYILCLNTDTLLINNAIKIMFDFMEKEENQNVGVCGGYIVNGDNEPIICAGYFPTAGNIIPRILSKIIFKKDLTKKSPCIKSNELDNNQEVDYINGADIFFRKSVLDKVGLFDEKFFMYFEETDLCKRIKNAGYSIKFVKDAQIKHFIGKSVSNPASYYKMFRKSEIIYFMKHHPRQVWLVKLIYIILYLIDWLILGHKDSRDLIKVVLNG